jgi:NAD-dependent dihydropyrimidine dehydrogenase PreA subunit
VFYCPREVLALSNRRNQKGYCVAEVVDADNCTQCKLCEVSCPDLAIHVCEEVDELELVELC